MKLTYRPITNPTVLHTVALRSYDAREDSDIAVSLGGTRYRVFPNGRVVSREGAVGTRAYAA